MYLHISVAAVSLIILVVDQLSKIAAANNLIGAGTVGVIPYIINFVYVENRGGAWGILSSHRLALIVITLAVIAICIVLLFKYCNGKPLLFWAVSLVVTGGVGNMIDRLIRGYVIDFLQFDFYKTFPVFNIADIAVVTGCGLMILYFILDTVKVKIKNEKN